MTEIIRKIRNDNKKLTEIIRFLFVGGVATVIDFLVMALVMYLPNKEAAGLFVDFIKSNHEIASWLVILASAIGFITGLIFNYIFSIFYVYDYSNDEAKTKKGFIKFALLSVVGLGIQTLGMFIGYSVLHMNKWLIKIILVFIVLAFNYITRKIFIFKKSTSNEHSNDECNLCHSGKQDGVNIKYLIFCIILAVSTSGITNLFYISLVDFGSINFALKYLYMLATIVIVFTLLFLLRNIAKIKIDFSKTLVVVIAVLYTITIIMYYVQVHSIMRFKYEHLLMLLLGLFAIFVYSYLLIDYVTKKIVAFCRKLESTDKYIFCIFVILGVITCSILFFLTSCFTYSNGCLYDAMFSFDNGYQIVNKTQFNFWIGENDIRHVIMSLCQLPFCVIPLLLTKIFAINKLYGLLISYVQVLLYAYILLKLIHFSNIKEKYNKILFSIIFFVSVGTFLNMVTTEKFVIALFFIVLFISSIKDDDELLKYIALFGAIGTLTTNIVLIPLLFINQNKPKEHITNFFAFAICSFCVIFVFGQFNVFYNMLSNIKLLIGFTGMETNSGIAYKASQFFVFIKTLFLFPNFTYGYFGLMQASPTDSIFDIVFGVVIFVAVIISFIYHRKDYSSRICFYMFCFMFLLLFIIGWGSPRNEMFIYTSMFLWAIYILIYQLFDFIKNKKIRIAVFSIFAGFIIIYNFIYLINFVSIMMKLFPTTLG